MLLYSFPWFLQKIGCSAAYLRRKELPRWELMLKNTVKIAKLEMGELVSLISWGCEMAVHDLPHPLHRSQAVSPSFLMDLANGDEATCSDSLSPP